MPTPVWLEDTDPFLVNPTVEIRAETPQEPEVVAGEPTEVVLREEALPLPTGNQHRARHPLFNRAVCVCVTLRRMGTRKKVETADVQPGVDTDEGALRVTKELISGTELTRLDQLDRQIRKYLYSECLPSPLRRNFYLLPNEVFQEVNGRLTQLSEERARLVNEFIERYPQLIEEARTRLGRLFNQLDYPPEDRLRRLFSMEVRYIQFEPPQHLWNEDADVYLAEHQAHWQAWQETAELIQLQQRQQLRDQALHLAQRLGYDGTGEPLTIRENTLTQLKETLHRFPTRNVAEDAELLRVVQKLEQYLERVDIQILRRRPVIRDFVRHTLETIALPILQELVQEKQHADLGDLVEN